MNRKLHPSCTKCKAALFCRAWWLQWSNYCRRCDHDWVLMMPEAESGFVVMVTFDKLFCDNNHFIWMEQDGCPTCKDPNDIKIENRWGPTFPLLNAVSYKIMVLSS